MMFFERRWGWGRQGDQVSLKNLSPTFHIVGRLEDQFIVTRSRTLASSTPHSKTFHMLTSFVLVE
jgi:hypothetical protein